MFNIKYYVRTTGDRKFNYNLDYYIIKDTSYKFVKAFVNSLYKINDYNSVLLEDDLVLCKNFKEEIEKVINKYPNDIINFFSSPERFYTTHYSDRFEYNQCTYYPKGIAKLIADEMTRIEDIENVSTGYSIIERQALRNLGIPHLIYRPSLVQHKDNGSIFRKGVIYNRNTIYFKDYLDKLNLSMLDTLKEKNKNDLNNLLKQDRIIWLEEKMKGE